MAIISMTSTVEVTVDKITVQVWTTLSCSGMPLAFCKGLAREKVIRWDWEKIGDAGDWILVRTYGMRGSGTLDLGPTTAAPLLSASDYCYDECSKVSDTGFDTKAHSGLVTTLLNHNLNDTYCNLPPNSTPETRTRLEFVSRQLAVHFSRRSKRCSALRRLLASDFKTDQCMLLSDTWRSNSADTPRMPWQTSETDTYCNVLGTWSTVLDGDGFAIVMVRIAVLQTSGTVVKVEWRKRCDVGWQCVRYAGGSPLMQSKAYS